MMTVVIMSIVAFALGSVPVGLVVARGRGIDLKTSGSGNIGATNVLRTTGKWPALFTLAGDIGKGALAMGAARHLLSGDQALGIVGLFAILGHNFSPFVGFRGGKGVATSIGVLLVYAPQTGIITIIIWLMTVLLTRYSSMGALVAFGLMPVVMAVTDSQGKLPYAVIMTVLLFARHSSNIGRLLRGAEPRVGQK